MKTTLELNQKEIGEAIKMYVKNKHTMYEAESVSFNVNNTSDDRFGGGPRYELTSAIVTIKEK